MIRKKCRFPICFLWILSIVIACQEKKSAATENKLFDTLIDKAIAFETNQKYDSAFYYYFKAKEVCNSQEKDRTVYALFHLAEIQQKHCDYTESEATATAIIALHPNYKHIYSTYNILGLAYLEQYNYNTAIQYFNLASKTALNQSDKIIYTNNIAYALLEAKKYTQAQQLLTQIVHQKALLTNRKNFAKVADNLGYAYFKLNNPKAILFLNQALQIRDSLKNDFETIPSYIHLSEYYQKTNPNAARNFAAKAYQYATKINSPNERILALKYLIENTNPNQVKALAIKQMNIADSINKVRQLTKNQFANIKYDFKKANQQTEKYKLQKQILSIIILLIIIIVGLLFYAVKSANKRKLLTISYDTETRIAKKLHDELANDVFNTMTYAQSQDLQNANKKETLVDNLEKIYTRTRNISIENSPIDTGDNFEAVLKEMLSNYNSIQVNVIITKNNTIDWKKIKKEAKITLYRVLQEVMVNMKKHSKCSLVLISFDNLNRHIEINYSDNGIGCPDIQNLKKGLLNAENRILAIKGTITFETETNKGFKSKISIPK